MSNEHSDGLSKIISGLIGAGAIGVASLAAAPEAQAVDGNLTASYGSNEVLNNSNFDNKDFSLGLGISGENKTGWNGDLSLSFTPKGGDSDILAEVNYRWESSRFGLGFVQDETTAEGFAFETERLQSPFARFAYDSDRKGPISFDFYGTLDGKKIVRSAESAFGEKSEGKFTHIGALARFNFTDDFSLVAEYKVTRADGLHFDINDSDWKQVSENARLAFEKDFSGLVVTLGYLVQRATTESTYFGMSAPTTKVRDNITTLGAKWNLHDNFAVALEAYQTSQDRKGYVASATVKFGGSQK